MNSTPGANEIHSTVAQEKHEAVNEVMLLASINSPYVVKYYDSFMENDELHIVMEYCNR
jgi:NIMA (never in mitosis gene a)-related kinase 1/4/5